MHLNQCRQVRGIAKIVGEATLSHGWAGLRLSIGHFHLLDCRQAYYGLVWQYVIQYAT